MKKISRYLLAFFVALTCILSFAACNQTTHTATNQATTTPIVAETK